MPKTHHVILSGGVGSRLWPLSRQYKPKQYLPLLEGESLLKKTIDRNKNIADHLIIVCNENHKTLCEQIIDNMTQAAYIIESIPKNTAAAVAFAALSVSPDDILIVTPADHSIMGGELYDVSIQKGIDLAKNGFLITYGIVPTRPETGYGYIKHHGNDVTQFIEKPSLEKTKAYVASDEFLWNSGIFCFKAGVILEELKKHASHLYHKVKLTYNNSDAGVMPQDQSHDIPDKSLDIAVIEKSSKVKVIPCDFEWSDLGSFESLYEYYKSIGYPVDENGNMSINQSKHTAFVGLENCMIINTSDATLVLHIEKSQEVKKLYQNLSLSQPELM